jgi:hypothetical protein
VGKMFNTEITAGDPVVALQSEIQLKADKTRDFSVFMGIEHKETEKPYESLQVNQYKDNDYVEQKLQEVKAYWDHYLSHVKVNTPSESFNLMLNVWNQYQSAVTFDMARNSGYYHGGLAVRHRYARPVSGHPGNGDRGSKACARSFVKCPVVSSLPMALHCTTFSNSPIMANAHIIQILRCGYLSV